MKIESLQPHDDEYQVFDDNGTAIFKGSKNECVTFMLEQRIENLNDELEYYRTKFHQLNAHIIRQ